MTTAQHEKIVANADRLLAVLASYVRAAIAFSGGVDSTVVAKAAQLALGSNAVAITGTSASLAQGELENAQVLAAQIGIRHIVLKTDEFADPAYVANAGDRCYHCKSELYDEILKRQDELAFDIVCSGANLDDLGDYRPGLNAAAERNIRHPLQEANFTKSMVRDLASLWGLPNHDKPASPCLSSRIAVGLEVTPDRTRRIDLAEQFLRSQGFETVRVRYHPGDHARIEAAEKDLQRLMGSNLRSEISAKFKSYGFHFVSVDIEPFRSGSLNILVPEEMLIRSTRTIG